MVKRKGAFYALESIGAALILFYYVYKIFTLPLPSNVVVEKQNLYADDIFYLASSLDNITSYKKLWFAQYDEQDVAALYQYFISREGYFELYATQIPKKNIIVGKYVEPYRVYFTHYLTDTYTTDQACISTYFNNGASFGSLGPDRTIKCKEGLFKGYHVLLVLDRRKNLYFKSLYVDANANGKYDDYNDYIYTIGRFMDEDLFAGGSLYYIQDLPEENNTPYIYALYPYEKKFFRYLDEIKSIGNYSLSLKLRFFTNTTRSFGGFDVILWDSYLPNEKYDGELWKQTIEYWQSGGDVIVLSPLGNSTLLEEVNAYNNSYLGYGIYEAYPAYISEFKDIYEAYSSGSGYLLKTLAKYYVHIPLIFKDVGSFSGSYAHTIYQRIYLNLSSSVYHAYVVDDGSSNMGIIIDKDYDGDLNDETFLSKEDTILLNMTYYKVKGYGSNILLAYENGSPIYVMPLPSYFISSQKDIAHHTLLQYRYYYYALDTNAPFGHSYTFNAVSLGGDSYKVSISIGPITQYYYVMKKAGIYYLSPENKPLIQYAENTYFKIGEEYYRWSFDETSKQVILTLIKRPKAPLISYFSNDKNGDFLIFNGYNLSYSSSDFLSLLTASIAAVNSNNFKQYHTSSYKKKNEVTVVYLSVLDELFHPVIIVKKYL